MFDFLKPPEEDVRIELPTAIIIFHNRTKTAFLYDYDPNTPDDALDALEQHLKKRGYFLQVFKAGASVALPPQIRNAQNIEVNNQ